MKLYQVQLETRESTYCYEVRTDAFDYVEMARSHLALRLDHETAQAAHCGGTSKIGDEPGKPEVRFKMGRFTEANRKPERKLDRK